MKEQLQAQFGSIDIYLFDQLLKGRFEECKKVLDAGCGYGRNLTYFLRNGYEVYGLDQDPEAINHLHKVVSSFFTSTPEDNFKVEGLETISFEDNFFDLVICSAVLHFARDKAHFEQMLFSCWRVLKKGGYFFARLASSIGIEDKVIPLGEGRYLLPDGSTRYLVTEQELLNYTTVLNGVLIEPIKTTNVQGLRCMTTWCVQKR